MRNAGTGFAARLRQLRTEMGITQTELAATVGVKRSAVANWETGQRIPKNATFSALCRCFDVSADYLCGAVDARNQVIAPEVFHINLHKLNYDGQAVLYDFYEYLLGKEKYTRRQ